MRLVRSWMPRRGRCCTTDTRGERVHVPDDARCVGDDDTVCARLVCAGCVVHVLRCAATLGVCGEHWADAQCVLGQVTDMLRPVGLCPSCRVPILARGVSAFGKRMLCSESDDRWLHREWCRRDRRVDRRRARRDAGRAIGDTAGWVMAVVQQQGDRVGIIAAAGARPAHYEWGGRRRSERRRARSLSGRMRANRAPRTLLAQRNRTRGSLASCGRGSVTTTTIALGDASPSAPSKDPNTLSHPVRLPSASACRLYSVPALIPAPANIGVSGGLLLSKCHNRMRRSAQAEGARRAETRRQGF